MSHFCVSQEPLARLPATRSRPPFLPTSWVRKVRNSRRGRTSMWKKQPPPRAPGLARPRPEGCRRACAREDMPRHAACALRMLRFAARRCALVAIVNLRRWCRRFETMRRPRKFRLIWRVCTDSPQNSGPDQRALLAPNHHRRRSLTLLPARPLQIGDVILSLRKSETEVADELPVQGDIEDGGDGRRLEDRYPSHADAFGARRQPDRVDRRHRRILDHLRHGVTPEAVALRGRRIGEHRQMRWG